MTHGRPDEMLFPMAWKPHSPEEGLAETTGVTNRPEPKIAPADRGEAQKTKNRSTETLGANQRKEPARTTRAVVNLSPPWSGVKTIAARIPGRR